MPKPAENFHQHRRWQPAALSAGYRRRSLFAVGLHRRLAGGITCNLITSIFDLPEIDQVEIRNEAEVEVYLETTEKRCWQVPGCSCRLVQT